MRSWRVLRFCKFTLTVALENARAEIEVLRNEIAVGRLLSLHVDVVDRSWKDLEGLTASSSSEKVAELAQRSSQERARLTEEIASLRQQLADVQKQTHPDGDAGELQEQSRALRSTIDLVGVCQGYYIRGMKLTL